jgi:DNA-binding CsgD family transcriptional regulator
MDPLEQIGLSPEAADAYLTLLNLGVQPADAIAPKVRHELQAAGLVHCDGTGVHPASPRQPLEAWAGQRLQEALNVRQAAEALSLLYDQRPGSERLSVEVVYGREPVSAAGERLQAQARSMVRMWDRAPYVSSNVISLPQEQAEAMARGVEYRTVYEGRTLQDAVHLRRLRECVAGGEQARIHSALPMKMLLSDEREGIIALPSPATGKVEAVVISSSLLLEALAELFEMVWTMAIPVDPRATPDDALIEDEPTSETIQLLCALTAGLSDRAVARDLGVSERTVQRRIYRLQELLGANGRFQLGVQAARRGWL